MEPQFWHQKWEKNDIGFHQFEVNPFLSQFYEHLGVVRGQRIFIPLCGKTLDIAWLLAKGYRIVGVELSKVAVEQLFLEMGLQPVVTQLAQFEHYHAENLDIFVGDVFHLSSELLGKVDAVYDRAALVALPSLLRQRYSQHVSALVSSCPQLLISFDYDQALMSGPPFSVPQAEIEQLYSNNYEIKPLIETVIVGGFKGQIPAREHVFLLLPR